MGMEQVRLHTRDDRVVDGTAEVIRRSTAERAGRAGGIALAGVALGAVSIAIPVVHLISTWLIPLIGFVLAYFVYRTAVVVPEVRCTCPDCGAETVMAGGAWEDPMWVRCTSCTLPLSVELS